MLQPTEQIVQPARPCSPTQPAALRALADLTETAIGYGARHLPMWWVDESGMVRGTLTFPVKPRPCDLNPWRLAIGAHEVEHFPYCGQQGWFMTDQTRFTVNDLSVTFSVTYPYTPVGLEQSGVAA